MGIILATFLAAVFGVSVAPKNQSAPKAPGRQNAYLSLTERERADCEVWNAGRPECGDLVPGHVKTK